MSMPACSQQPTTARSASPARQRTKRATKNPEDVQALKVRLMIQGAQMLERDNVPRVGHRS
jgi:hypothetical protein